MAKIRHQLKIKPSHEQIHNALSDRDALARWNNAEVGGDKDVWTFADTPPVPSFAGVL